MSRSFVSWIFLILLLWPLSVLGGGESNPTDVLEETASVCGKGVTVQVKNLSTSPVVVELTGFYDDLTEIHTAQSIVSLGSRETAAVTVVFTITDDITPQVSITEGPDPIPNAIVLGTAPWSD
jgi:hypothetical protein